ncbi:MAG: hypothetical protein AAF989_12095 [Planctomycetota bacterium]
MPHRPAQRLVRAPGWLRSLLQSPSWRRALAILGFAIWSTNVTYSVAEAAQPHVESTQTDTDDRDHLWVISTRHLLQPACRAPLESPNLFVSRLDSCGRTSPTDLNDYLANRRPSRPTVIYVHGNRIDSTMDAIRRSLSVYRDVRRYRHVNTNASPSTVAGATSVASTAGPIDWVVWSWPSQREALALKDVRIKAARTDAQGLYLAWLLRHHVFAGQPTAMVGYSFGGRIITGSLHALAGGALGGRRLPGESITGAQMDIGLVAPALEADWMANCGYHRLATKNLDSMTLLFNRRDAVLKNYWRLDRIRNADALGYTGPKHFAPRIDGSRLPVQARDCAAAVGRHHSELDYYTSRCRGGFLISRVVSSSTFHN